MVTERGKQMNQSGDPKVASEVRNDARIPLAGEVTITLATNEIYGSGQNISTQGLYFTTKCALLVQVKIEGRDQPVPAELIRLESMGNGCIGLAVRFQKPLVG
jgi:hypothetical protein